MQFNQTDIQRRPLYSQVADVLRRKIKAMEFADNLPGENRLAADLGVSVATIREALRLLATEGYVERVQGRRTRITGQSKQRGHIGILIETDISNPNASPNYLCIAMALKRRLEGENYAVVLYLGSVAPGSWPGKITCHEFTEAAQSGQLSAAIVLSWAVEGYDEILEGWGVPVIRYGYDCEWGVSQDPKGFIQQAVERAVVMGRSKLAYLSWDGRSGYMRHCRSTYFKKHLVDHGLKGSDGWVLGDLNPTISGAGWEAFREIWLAQDDRPDALIVADDCLLRDALVAIYEIGIKVPSELCVVANLLDSTHIPGANKVIRFELKLDAIIDSLVTLLQARLEGRCPRSKRITLQGSFMHPAAIADSLTTENKSS